MGFYVMLLSFLLGIGLTVIGVTRRKQNTFYLLSVVLGILLILFAVYLARPH